MLSDDQYAGSGTKAIDMFSRLLNHSSQLVMDGVKNLVIKRHNLPVTKVVDVLMEQKTSPSEIADEYRYFDPKLLRSTDRLDFEKFKEIGSNQNFDTIPKCGHSRRYFEDFYLLQHTSTFSSTVLRLCHVRDRWR
jgi:hypothetical protein